MLCPSIDSQTPAAEYGTGGWTYKHQYTFDSSLPDVTILRYYDVFIYVRSAATWHALRPAFDGLFSL